MQRLLLKNPLILQDEEASGENYFKPNIKEILDD